VKVSSGQQLLDQLNNNTARYIQLTRSISIPPSTPQGAVTVNRIVEVRACHPDGSADGVGGLYEIDWGETQGAVAVGGNLIFNGDLLMTGLGWKAAGEALENVVGALAPQVRGASLFRGLFGFRLSGPVLAVG